MVTLDMANLRPSSVGAYVHVYQNLDQRARDGPRIKVYPGSPGAGDATTIAIPHDGEQEPYVTGSVTVSRAVLRKALHFADLNRDVLTRYWANPDMGTDELLDELVAVD